MLQQETYIQALCNRLEVVVVQGDGQDTKCGISREGAYAQAEYRAVCPCNTFRLDGR
jgi:hypothetical protein